MGHSKPDPSSFEPNQPEVQPEHNLHGANNGYVPPANQNDQHQLHPPNVPENGPQPQQFSQPPNQKLSPGRGPPQQQQHPVNHHQYPNYYHTQPGPNPHTNFMYPNGIHQPAPYPTQSPPPPSSHPNQAYQTHPAHHPPPPPPQYHNFGAQNVPPPPYPSHTPSPAYNQNAHIHNPQFSPHNNGGQAGYAAQGIPVPVQNQVPTEKWSSELFDCMDDPMNGDLYDSLLIPNKLII